MRERYALCLLAALFLVPAGSAFAGEDQKPKQKKGWLGVSMQTVTERIQKREQLPSDEGAYVADVIDDSPADSAGLKRGDVIVSFGGKSVYEPDDLSRFVSRTTPGARTEVVYYRDGVKKTATVVVGTNEPREYRDLAITVPDMPRFEFFMGGVTLGATVKTLNKQLAAYFGVPNGEGALVEEVEKDRPAAKAGVVAGDVIIRIGKRTVDNVDDISKELRKAEAGDKLDLEVWRKGARKTLTVEIPEGGGDEGDRFERHLFRMRPGTGMMEWHDEDHADDEATVRIKKELDQIRVMPKVAPSPSRRMSNSMTI